MVKRSKNIMSIEEKLKEFEEKLRKQYELQEKLDSVHKEHGTAQYGSLDGNIVALDMSKVSVNGNGNGNGHSNGNGKHHEEDEVRAEM